MGGKINLLLLCDSDSKLFVGRDIDPDAKISLGQIKSQVELQQELNKPEPEFDDQNEERNTTLSYQLKDRRAVSLPNPVYTCEGFGKIVISIVVNGKGEIKDAKFNPTLSSTTNQCLIDSALDYARRSLFSEELSREKQLGTISYNFPGQD